MSYMHGAPIGARLVTKSGFETCWSLRSRHHAFCFRRHGEAPDSFYSAVLSNQRGFLHWLRRELATLWSWHARIFPLQSAPFVDLRVAVLLPVAHGHELPVLLEINDGQDTWREIHVVTQAVTVSSLVWRSRLITKYCA